MAPGDATRARLIDGAAACFYRYGVGKTTIDEIAKEVRLSRRTVYRYFASKEDIFAAVISREFDELSKEGRLIYEQSPFGEGVIEVALLMSRRVAESPVLSRLFAVEEAGETLEALFGGTEFTSLVERFLAPLIRRAQQRGELRKDITIADATEWVTHLVFSLLGPNPVINRHDDEHVKFMLRVFALPGLTVSPVEAPPTAARRTARAKS
ncbi:TetR/AcrR family transcriptional regulator [Rhodococcus sp. NPDC057529]|uniref:TetR/AcrR family transcriptional regulator n=1 Tax=Rhodococcus sp. NPDC057529 TaxID=3346158 RepID=UPI003671FF07